MDSSNGKKRITLNVRQLKDDLMVSQFQSESMCGQRYCCRESCSEIEEHEMGLSAVLNGGLA